MAYKTQTYIWQSAYLEDDNIVLRRTDGYIKRCTLQYIQDAIAACDLYLLENGTRAPRHDEWEDILEKWERLS